MEIKQEQVGAITVLTPVGRLDPDSATDFELAAQDQIALGVRHFVVDCAELGYVSSAGLRVLTSMVKQLETQRGSLRLAGMSAAVRQVFELAGMSKMFAIHADRAAALAGHPQANAPSPIAPAPAKPARPPRDAAAAPAAAPAPAAAAPTAPPPAAPAQPPPAAPAPPPAKPDIGQLAAKILGAKTAAKTGDNKRAGMAKVFSDLLGEADKRSSKRDDPDGKGKSRRK